MAPFEMRQGRQRVLCDVWKCYRTWNIGCDMLEIDISSKENIESVLIHDQAIKDVKTFINTMPESLKTAYTLREVEGKSYEEISIITETPIGTVRSRIFRARESIVEYMRKELINNE